MFSQIPELNNIIEGDGDGDFRCANKSENFLRVKLEPLNGVIWGIKESNTNPTIDIDDEGVIQFCLAPYDESSSDRHVISCMPQEGQQEIILNKVRDSLPFMTFANIPFNIYVNGSLVASNITLFDANDLVEVGLKVTDLTDSGRKISIFNSSPEQRAYELQPDVSDFAADTDIELGLVEVYERSFHMCLAPTI